MTKNIKGINSYQPKLKELGVDKINVIVLDELSEEQKNACKAGCNCCIYLYKQ